ncbi:MAG: hypothetical protein VX977_06575 [Pseudomonadota bacterium]|jgi:hypothetical protein|nr:hypothetical protein [Pseudomonadota bacterium]
MILVGVAYVIDIEITQGSSWPKSLALSLTETKPLGILSVQTNSENDISGFCCSVLGESLELGEMSGGDTLRLIRHWPHKVYLIADGIPLPKIESRYAGLITDISDAFCKLCLAGERSIAFLDQYCLLGLTQENILKMKTAKTMLGHYPVVIWWDDEAELSLLVERSLSQSFQDYLSVLAQRGSIE